MPRRSSRGLIDLRDERALSKFTVPSPVVWIPYRSGQVACLAITQTERRADLTQRVLSLAVP